MCAQSQRCIEACVKSVTADTCWSTLQTRNVLRQELNTNAMAFFTTHASGIPDGSDKKVGVGPGYDRHIFRSGVSKQCSIGQDVNVDKRHRGTIFRRVGEIHRCGKGQGRFFRIRYLQIADFWRKGAQTASLDGCKAPTH
jgi:hypothetical protein